MHWILDFLSMALTSLCRALFHLWCRKLDMPSIASPMKLDTSVVIILHFCILGIWGRSKFISFSKMLCMVLLYDFINFYNILQMVQFSYKRSSNLTYIFLFLYFNLFYYPNMHTCCHNLILKTLDPLLKVIWI